MAEVLSQALLETFDKPFSEITEKLKELSKGQEILLQKLEQQQNTVKDIPEVGQLLTTLSVTASYHTKATEIRKNIQNINERVSKLKKRAEKLRKQRETEEIALAEKKQREKEYEAQLLAKPAKTLTSSLEIQSLPSVDSSIKKN